MKKITLLFTLVLGAFGYSQNAPVNFETPGIGASWTFTVFENATNPAVEIVANPSPTGINTSGHVAKITALQAGQPWAGCESMHNTDLGTFTLSASNCIVKVMVWKSVISDVGVKFSTASGGSTGEIKVANTLVNQWEQLTFDFSGKIGEATSTGIDQLVFFPDFALSPVRTADDIVYFDNITFSAQTSAPIVPLVAAPTPIYPAANVISMFSNAYTNVGVDTWRTTWSNASLIDLQIAGNDTKKYSSLDYVGIETTGANLINASNMQYFNVDMWTPNVTTFRIKLVDFGADGVFGGGDDKDSEITYTTPATQTWNTYHIPLSSFATLATKGHIAQLIFSGLPTGSGVIYIDNVFFNNGAVVPPSDPMVAAPTPTYPAADVISMFSNAYTNVGVDTWHTSWSNGTLTDLQIVGNDTKKYSALDFVGIETTGANLINATNMQFFNFNMWSADATVFKVKLVDFGADGVFGGTDDKEHEIIYTAPANGVWNTYHIPLTDFAGLTTRGHIAQLIFSAVPSGSSTVFIDNVFFNKGAVIAPTDPMTAAPTPTLPASSVISMFSNAYTNVGVDTWRTSWSNATLTDLQIVGNDTKKYTALDFVGIETTGANIINASTMNYFHVDMWTPNMTTFRVKLVDFGADGAFGGGDDKEHEVVYTSPAMSTWNSYHIALSDFTNLTTRSHIAQLIFSGLPTAGGTVYIDNVYFSTQPLQVTGFESSVARMYPNPTSSSFTIDSTNAIEKVSVINMLGQEILSQSPNMNSVNIDMSGFNTGVYLVKTQIEGKISTARVVKN